MRKLSLTLLAGLGALALSASAIIAQDSGPLLDLLIKKGLINDQEAEQLRSDLTKDFAANTAAGKLNLSSGLTELRIAGDVRARYEIRSGQLPSGDSSERDRFRYRFRTGLYGKLYNDWSFGIRLETASGSRSSNVTMADDGGPWAKTSDTVNVGQIYAQWTPRSDFTLTVGRMANPLVSTLMVWDADINPEGLAEQFKRRSGKLEYSATLGQFLYAGASTQNAYGTTANAKELALLAWQGGVKYYIEGATRFFQFNPTFYNFYSGDFHQIPTAFRGNFTASNAGAVNDLFIFDLPMEYDWVAGGVPVRVFADFAVNLDGSHRATGFGRPDLKSENKAYSVGLQYGKAANRGEWDAKVFYQSVGAFALDPNLVDSDIFDSRTNMRGVVFSANYALGAATQLTFTFADGARKNKSLIAPGAGDVGSSNALDKYVLFQTDLNLKF